MGGVSPSEARFQARANQVCAAFKRAETLPLSVGADPLIPLLERQMARERGELSQLRFIDHHVVLLIKIYQAIVIGSMECRRLRESVRYVVGTLRGPDRQNVRGVHQAQLHSCHGATVAVRLQHLLAEVRVPRQSANFLHDASTRLGQNQPFADRSEVRRRGHQRIVAAGAYARWLKHAPLRCGSGTTRQPCTSIRPQRRRL